MKLKTRNIFLGLVLIASFGCDKEPDKPDFDREAMLSNLASNVIKPSIAETASSISDLESATQIFVANPTQANLDDLQDDFIFAYKKFQHVKPLNFGAFEDYGIVGALNTYPTDTSKIKSNITSGSYNLGSVENIQAIGFPALDYLLFHSNDAQIITDFTTDTESTNRKTLLSETVTKMKTEIELAQTQWDSDDTGFISADGNDVGGSTSILFNAFVMDIELLKNAKIGIPAGNQTGGTTLPHYVEAYYSQSSIDLAKESVAGLKNIFTGGTGIGFEEYIRDVEGEVETSLADQIISKFDQCTTSLNQIGTPLSNKVDSDNATVQLAYNEIKSLVTLIKTDMSSALGLLITFQDNDGD